LAQPPGTIVDGSGLVSCGSQTALRLLRVQPENAKTMDFSAAVNGGHVRAGTRFN